MSAPVLKRPAAPIVVAIGADQRGEGHIRDTLEAAGFVVEIHCRARRRRGSRGRAAEHQHKLP